MESTIAFDEKVKGFTSFFSFIPDTMIGMNNRFFSFKNGDLYEHHIGDINTFYEEKFPSIVTVIFNEMPGEDKIFKTIFLEGTKAWDMILETDLNESSINKEEFDKRESRWFAYTRGNEDENDLSGLNIHGIGVSRSFDNNTISFSRVNDLVCVGDELFEIQNNLQVKIGVIKNVFGETIELKTIENPIHIGSFCFAKGNSRVASGSLRGYYMKAELKNNSNERIELFAANTKVVKSHV